LTCKSLWKSKGNSRALIWDETSLF